MEISVFRGNAPENTKFAERVMDLEFSELGGTICNHLWAPGVFRQKTIKNQDGTESSGLHRTNENLVKIELLTLDFDSGPTLAETVSKLERLGYQAIIGTTRNHQKDKKLLSGKIIPACDRYRVVIPLDSPVENDQDFKATWHKALNEFPGIDISCKDSARFYYPCREIVKTFEGKSFPVALAETLEKTKHAPSAPATKGKLSIATLKFFAYGAPNGEWHPAFFKAAMDLKQNNFSIEEARVKLQKASTNDSKTLDETDLCQLKDIYENRAPKYPPRIDGTRKGYDLKSIRELLEAPDEKCSWVVDQLLPSGGVSILAGKPKAGKTTLARCLALAVSKGDPFLGKFTERGTVLMLALEEKEAEVKKHFKAMGTSHDDNIFLHVAVAPKNPIEELKPIIVDKKPILIIIDPLFRFMRVRDSNDYAGVTGAFEPVVELAREYNTHLLFVHHLGKGDRQGCDAILGSTAIFGAVDTAITLKRNEKYRTIASQQRYGEDLDETILNFDEQSRKIVLGETKQEADLIRVGNEIIEALTAAGEPLKETEISDRIEGKTSLQRSALRKFVEEGKIIRSGAGGKKDPYKYQLPGSIHVSPVPTYIREHENKNLPLSAMEDFSNV